MGCCGSTPVKAPPVETAPEAPSSPRPRSHGALLHTNSMLFSKDAMNEAKMSLRLERPVSRALSVAANDADELSRVLLPSDNGYELGDLVMYAPEMLEPLSIRLASAEADEAEVVPESEGSSEGKPDDENGQASDEKSAPASARDVSFGYSTIRGRSSGPTNKPNQDSVVAFKLEGKPNHAVFGVFDGHGPFGEHASHFCRMRFHQTMLDVYEEKGDDTAPEDLLDETIRRVHTAFIESDPAVTNVDPLVSGTTLIVALIKDDVVYVANVGDSRCVYAHRPRSDKSKAHVIAMSDDHKPERDSERERIQKTEAILMSEGELRGGKKNEGKVYICRAKEGLISYGVLFTRSIGDLDAHIHLGVSAEPEFKHVAVDNDFEQYLVLASDGVWDQLTNEEVMRTVFKIKNPLKASEAISAAARDKWDNDKAHSRRDDITTCVVRLS